MKHSNGFLIQFSKVKGSVFRHDELSKNSIMVFHQKGGAWTGQGGVSTHSKRHGHLVFSDDVLVTCGRERSASGSIPIRMQDSSE